MAGLWSRPLETRCMAGVIADAARGPFPQCSPGGTLDRAIFKIDSLFSSSGNGESHPYRDMWKKINLFYDCNNWGDLSNDNLVSVFKDIAGCGYKKLPGDATSPLIVSPAEVREACERWNTYGWINYEQKKKDKVSTATKAARYLVIGSTVVGGSFLGPLAFFFEGL